MNLENLTPYQRWQYEKFGNIEPENNQVNSHQPSVLEAFLDRNEDLQPENIVSQH